MAESVLDRMFLNLLATMILNHDVQTTAIETVLSSLTEENQRMDLVICILMTPDSALTLDSRM